MKSISYILNCIKRCWKKHSLMLVAVSLYIMYSITFIFVKYNTAEDTLLKQVEQTLTMGAKSVSYILPENFHQQIYDAYPNDLDNINIRRLTSYAEENNIRFVYSFAKSGKNVIFTSSSLSTNDNPKCPEIRYGFVCAEPNDGILKAFRNTGALFQEENDKYGRHFTVYWTREENGKKWVAGAELRKDIYSKKLDKAVLDAIFDLLAASLATTLIALVVYYHISRKMVRLTEENKRQRNLIKIMSRR